MTKFKEVIGPVSEDLIDKNFLLWTLTLVMRSILDWSCLISFNNSKRKLYNNTIFFYLDREDHTRRFPSQRVLK